MLVVLHERGGERVRANAGDEADPARPREHELRVFFDDDVLVERDPEGRRHALEVRADEARLRAARERTRGEKQAPALEQVRAKPLRLVVSERATRSRDDGDGAPRERRRRVRRARIDDAELVVVLHEDVPSAPPPPRVPDRPGSSRRGPS